MANDITTDDIEGPGEHHEALDRALSERYLTYALSTIMHRALPDARDGLKPVHRRILWAMRALRLDPGQAFKKSARIVGDVIGKYHPHGDTAAYDALVRVAQDFSVRYPLVDGQGNFGNIDGDGAAAYRYTEARLTPLAARLMEGLDEDAVDFRPTFNNEDFEPEVLPAAFPNLLANGASGIAVGMATSIPPHNLGELCRASLHLIEHPGASVDTLMKYLPGPDFPTGGVMVDNSATIAEAYRTGKGGVRLRAAWEREDLGRGQWQIVVTEIPYQVQKAKLVERLAELVTSGKVRALADVRDESAEDVRLILEPRARSIDPQALMETLFRQSDLETRVSINMTVLIDGRTPKVATLPEMLRAWLDHRREVLVRRTEHRLGKIAARLEVLGGYLVAYLNLDRVIEIIRTEDEPKQALMAENWATDGGTARLTDVQAEAILNMRLRALRKLEEMAIREERERLLAEQDALQGLVASEEDQWKQVAEQIREIMKDFGAPRALAGITDAADLAERKKNTQPWPQGARRTGFATPPDLAEDAAETLIEREPITVVCSEQGWIRAMTGHRDASQPVKFKDGDGPRFHLTAMTTDRLLIFASDGRVFTLACDRLPGGRGMGEPVRLLAEMAQEAEIVTVLKHEPGTRLVVASTAGDGFLLPADDAVAQTRGGRQVLNVKGGVRLAAATPVGEADHLAVVGQNRKLLIFPLSDLPEMTRGKGVRLQKYKDGGLSDFKPFRHENGLSWPMGSKTRTLRPEEMAEWVGPRASTGRMAPRGFPQSNRFA
ncbi:MAG: DNA topoisomerase IV subunit A [Pseudomonadota bacterium]